MRCEQGLDTYAGDGQGSHPDWAGAASRGHLRGVSLQATYGTVTSTTFASWRQQLRALGIPVVGYGFLRFGLNMPTPETQAKSLLQVVGAPNTHEMTPVLDLEFGGKRPDGMSAKDVTDWFLRAFHTITAELGVAPGVYTSAVVMSDPAQMNNPSIPELADAWLWVKDWPYAVGTAAITDPTQVDAIRAPHVPPQFDGQWMWHQYQGDAPGFPAMIGKVDTWRSPILEMGASGGSVRYVQRRVKATIDGVFGPQTQAAVMAFQRQMGLVADGRVGLTTKAALSWTRV